jgi:hypothetical protein
VYPQLLTENAQEIYAVAKDLHYVELIEGADYTTTRYNVTINGNPDQITIPKEMYYQFVVSPILNYEAPTYINPSTHVQAAPPTGKFWRDYYYNHADSNYPADPGSIKYPKDENPPLLKEKIAGITTLWDYEAYLAPSGYDDSGHNNGRPWGYKNHAIECVGNWVDKTLPLNYADVGNTGLRSNEPVNVMALHYGNCGELQQITSAAARTVLIPSATTMDWNDDHVWSEFYLDKFYHWDNMWSDSGSKVNMPYDMETWADVQKRGGVGEVMRWYPDSRAICSDLWYSDWSTIIFTVKDTDGAPVDGAYIRVCCYEDPMGDNTWTYKYISMWNTTGPDGKTSISVGDGRTKLGRMDDLMYQIGLPTQSARVDSSDPSRTIHKDDLTTIHSAEAGNHTYNYTFTITGSHPRKTLVTDITPPTPPTENYRWNYSFDVQNSYVYSRDESNPTPRHYWQDSIKADLRSFVCDATNYALFRNFKAFNAWDSSKGTATSGSYGFDGTQDLYYVISNDECSATSSIINYTITVSGSSVPEVPVLFITAIGMLGLFAVVTEIRKRKDD